MILLDCGTSYAKILDTESGERRLAPARDLPAAFRADIACGHNVAGRAAHVVNELVALARAALRLTEESDFVVLDVGARDTKYVRVSGRGYGACDWNSSCGALSGLTIEMLGRYYDLDFSAIEPAGEGMPVTCGVFGMSTMFDLIGAGRRPEEAVAAFVRGTMESIHAFCGKPGEVLLSGGLCDNPLALRSFPCRVEPIGRYALLEGLKDYMGPDSALPE